MKKLTVLFIAILLPLLAAFFVGRYAYTDRYSPDNTASEPARNLRSDLFGDYLSEGKTTKEKLELYLKFRTIQYDPTPIFSSNIKNSNDKDLFTIDVYSTLYYTMVDDERVQRVSFAFHLYDVQYQNIKDTFVTEDRKGVNAADDPTLTITLTNDKQEEYNLDFSFSTANNVPIVTDVKTDSEDPKPALIGDAKAGIKEWNVDSVKVDVNATIVLDNVEHKQSISNFDIDNFQTNLDKLNLTKYQEGYESDYNKLGINTEIFTRYVWWQSLLTFVIVGFITISFYIVWNAEVNAKVNTKYSKLRKSKK